MRKVMDPFTASNLKLRKRNVLKDFVAIAGPLGVSHFLMFSKTNNGNNLRIACLPHGPTLTFQIDKYSLRSDVIESLKRPQTFEGQYKYPPLLVLNSFNSPENSNENTKPGNEGFKTKPDKLCLTILQNMFPSININKVNLNHVKRCAMFNYDLASNILEFRHYNIAVKPVGVSRKMKRLVSKKKLPNLSRYTDISEFLLQQGDGSASESEPEIDISQSKVELPQDVSGVGNTVNEQSAIRLTEIGPRLTLKLLKIEEGMCDGAVLFHRYIIKTPAEMAATEKMREEKKKLKQKRKQQQDENIKQKKISKEEHKKKSLAGMKRKADPEIDDDDAEWYKKEVGEEPTEQLFDKNSKSRIKHKNGKKKKSK